jgi:hypothetical protein
MNIGKLIALVLTLIGLCQLKGALYLCYDTSHFLGHAVRTKGVVLVPVSRYQNGKYEFVDLQGREHVFSPSDTENSSSFKQGQIIDVLYLPDNVGDARLNRFGELWGGVMVLAILACGFGGLGITFWILLRRGPSEKRSARGSKADVNFSNQIFTGSASADTPKSDDFSLIEKEESTVGLVIEMIKEKWFAGLVALVGVGLMSIGIHQGFAANEFLVHAVRTKGVVVSSGTKRYKPEFSFIDQHGAKHEFWPVESSGSDKYYKRDQIVDVLYLPDEPETARLESFTSTWFLPLFLTVFGGVITIIGSIFLYIGVVYVIRNGWLRHHGRRILTTVKEVRRIGRGSTAIPYQYVVTTRWKKPGERKQILFSSEPLADAPACCLDNVPVTVHVLPGFPSIYYMDLSFLRKSAIDLTGKAIEA